MTRPPAAAIHGSELEGLAHSQIGWEMLVGELSGRTLLTVDDSAASLASLATRCSRLFVLASDDSSKESLCQIVQEGGWTHVTVIKYGEFHTVHAEPLFDGAVINYLGNHSRESHDCSRHRLLATLRPALRDGAFVAILAHNRTGFRGRRFVFRPIDAFAATDDELRSDLNSVGISNSAVYPVVVDERDRIVEVIPPAGYLANRNVGLLVERAKRLLWSPPFAKRFTPALAIVGWLGLAKQSMVEALRDATAAPTDTLVWTQCLSLLSGKFILGFGSTTRSGNGTVLVVTRQPLAISRRSQEADDLRQLANILPAGLSRLLPQVMARLRLDGNECFVLSRLPGVTADAIVPGLQRVSAAATDFLIALHAATCSSVTMDSNVWALHLNPIFESARLRNPDVVTPIDQLEAALAHYSNGITWTSACSHGDFKIENILYDPQSYAITGVIDWEHAMLAGLPLIDVAYLIVYNRTLGGSTWLQAVRAFIDSNLDVSEERLLDAYLTGTGIPDRVLPVLRSLVVVHHIGCRRHGSWSSEEVSELRELLNACRSLVQEPIQ